MFCRVNALTLVSLFGGLWLGVLPLPDSGVACWAKVEGDRTLLERIQVAHISNREKLLTWEGQVSGVEFIKDAKRSVERTIQVDFAYDRNREAWRFRWTYAKTSDGKAQGAQFGGMLLDKAWHSCDYYIPGPNSAPGVSVKAGPPPKVGPMTTAFDPMSYFKVRYDDLENWIKLWVTNADTDWLSLVIRREGDLVTITEANVSIPKASARYVVDLSKGGNLVSLVARDPMREERWNNEFESRGGVWVPKTVRYENETLDGSDVSNRTLTWERSVVNEPVAADTFTLEAIGVVPGASISDHRTGEVSHYKMEEFQKQAKPPGAPPVEDRRSPALRNLVVGGSVLLLIIIVGILIGRRRLSAQR